jgi:uncharacterized protein YecE (DUF72 family)
VFFSRASLLKEKLGSILWQLPPSFTLDIDRLKEFVHALEPYATKNAFEFRNKTWINKKTIDLLGKENVALCFADYPDFLDKLPLTADFVYMRRHGKDGSYATSYNKELLKKDAKKIKSYVRQKKDVFMYFNNDAFGYAPKNAAELKTLLRKKR